jgi:hypothetical protein
VSRRRGRAWGLGLLIIAGRLLLGGLLLGRRGLIGLSLSPRRRLLGISLLGGRLLHRLRGLVGIRVGRPINRFIGILRAVQGSAIDTEVLYADLGIFTRWFGHLEAESKLRIFHKVHKRGQIEPLASFNFDDELYRPIGLWILILDFNLPRIEVIRDHSIASAEDQDRLSKANTALFEYRHEAIQKNSPLFFGLAWNGASGNLRHGRTGRSDGSDCFESNTSVTFIHL